MKKILLAIAGVFALATGAQAQSIVSSVPYTFQNGTLADATQVNANFNAIVTGVNANAAHNGSNADITSLSALAVPLTAAQGGETYFRGGTSGGSANAQTVATVAPSNYLLVAGNAVRFVAGFTNTGATTLNVASSGALPLVKDTSAGPVALTGGEVYAGNAVEALYDGTQYHLISNPLNNPFPSGISYSNLLFGAWTSVASATTTDLGAQLSRNLIITGTTTITSFGSTATPDNIPFHVRFAGALTLTNGSNLILPGAANITTAANDEAIVVQETTGTWRVTSYQIAANPPSKGLTQMTAQTASGTNVDFTNIPSWVHKVTIAMTGLSVNSNNPIIQLGTGSTPATSGYSSSDWQLQGGGTNSSTSGFVFGCNANVGATLVYDIVNESGTTWVGKFNGNTCLPTVGYGNSPALGGPLGIVRITGGTFSGGTVNVLYE